MNNNERISGFLWRFVYSRGLQVGVLSGPSHCPRFRKKYKGKHDKNNNNAKDGVNLSIEKAYEKVVKNVDGVSARKSKKPLRSANDFPFVFSNDNRADEVGFFNNSSLY